MMDLTRCVLSDDLRSVQYLLRARADANAKDEVGQAPLLRAANALNVDIVQALLKSNADANTMSCDRRTPLHKVAISGFTRFGELMEESSPQRKVFLHRSAELAKVLLDHRADPNIQSGTMDVMAARHGETPLHVAAALGRHELAKVLIQGGADTNLVTSNGLTAMDNAAGRGCAWGPGWRSESGAAKVAESLDKFQKETLQKARGEFEDRDTVKIVGLQARPDLNGQIGSLVAFVVSKQRWQVALGDGSAPIGVRAANLVRIAKHAMDSSESESADDAQGFECGNHITNSDSAAAFYKEYCNCDARGDSAGAFRNLKKSVQLMPEHEAVANCEAVANLAYMYLKGNGVRQNDRKAADLFQQALDFGDTDVAAVNLGYLYLNGRGVKKDLRKAVQLFRRAHKTGDIHGTFNLARMHLEGYGVAKNFALAHDLFQQARKGGHVKATANLAWMSVFGQHVPQDTQRAIALFQEACDAGDVLSGQLVDLLIEDPDAFLEGFYDVGRRDVAEEVAREAAQRERDRRAEMLATDKAAEERDAKERLEREQEIQRQIQESNIAARALKDERRRGAGVAATALATEPLGQDLDGGQCVSVHSDSQPSNQRARKEQKRRQRLAAAKKKLAAAGAESSRVFLRETAEGFVERPEHAYPVESACPSKPPRAKKEKAAKVNDVAEDVTFNLWEGKLKHPGVVNEYNN
eukprot:TRINITY_DN32943_c0_g1_i1.p1 TRINITY_DN32943_c0_g1~~TRINITY_DN32943_c0_g1_i1.p1  ORF type:complete len:696 (-),score=108.60 TRINITY_DN32943_c0_g1_i1:356-2443(-)